MTSTNASDWRRLPIPEKICMWACLTMTLFCLVVFIRNIVFYADGVTKLHNELTADTADIAIQRAQISKLESTINKVLLNDASEADPNDPSNGPNSPTGGQSNDA